MGQPKSFLKGHSLLPYKPCAKWIIASFLSMWLLVCSRSAGQRSLVDFGLSFPLVSETKPSLTVTKPCSKIRKLSLKKAVDHAPNLSSLVGRKALCLETAPNWLFQFMTSRPLTPEFENNNSCGGEMSEELKSRCWRLQAEPSCLVR